MEVIYEILYKNGKEDVITQRVTEDNVSEIEKVNNTFKYCMGADSDGLVTFGDGTIAGYMVRVADVSRVKISTRED